MRIDELRVLAQEEKCPERDLAEVKALFDEAGSVSAKASVVSCFVGRYAYTASVLLYDSSESYEEYVKIFIRCIAPPVFVFDPEDEEHVLAFNNMFQAWNVFQNGNSRLNHEDIPAFLNKKFGTYLSWEIIHGGYKFMLMSKENAYRLYEKVEDLYTAPDKVIELLFS